MIEIPFAPELVLGPLRVAWHSLFAFLGLLAGSQVAFRCARYLVRDGRVYAFAASVVLGGLVSARIAHLWDNWPRYAERPEEILAFWNGGSAVTGSPVGAALAALIAARVLRLPVGFMFDIAVIGIALGFAIGRLGDIVNGEHHAIACSALPWCVRYTNPQTLGQAHFVHPAVAYDLLWDLSLAGILLAYWRRVRGRPPEGRVFWLFIALYGAGRFFTSFLRLDPVVFAGLQAAQVIGVAYAVAGVAMLAILTRAGKRP